MLLPVTPCVTGNTDELKSSLWENWKVVKEIFCYQKLSLFWWYLQECGGRVKNPPCCSGRSTNHLYQHRYPIKSYREKLNLSFHHLSCLLSFSGSKYGILINNTLNSHMLLAKASRSGSSMLTAYRRNSELCIF